MRALWWVCVVATALNGLVVGYGAVWFQLFGDSPDREDYLVSAGGYLAAAAVVALALLATPALDVGTVALVCVAAVAALLALAGIGSIRSGLAMPPESLTVSGPIDGVGGVILLPWAWVLLWLSARVSWSRLRTATNQTVS